MEIDCEELNKLHMQIQDDKFEEFAQNVLNGRNIMIIYNALAFVANNKELFDKETNASLCGMCWEVLEEMKEQFSIVLDHLSTHLHS